MLRIINQYTGSYIVACDLHNMRYMYIYMYIYMYGYLCVNKSALHVRRRPSSDWNWAVRFTLGCKRASEWLRLLRLHSQLFALCDRMHSVRILDTYTWYVYVIKSYRCWYDGCWSQLTEGANICFYFRNCFTFSLFIFISVMRTQCFILSNVFVFKCVPMTPSCRKNGYRFLSGFGKVLRFL